MLERLVDMLRVIFPPSTVEVNGHRIRVTIPYDWMVLDGEAQYLLREADRLLTNSDCLEWVMTMPGAFMDMTHIVELDIRVGQQLILW